MKRRYHIILPLLSLCIAACTKYDERLDTSRADSGIIEVAKNGAYIGGAQIDETVTVRAKIGDPKAEIKIYVSDVEAQILSRGHRTGIVNASAGGKVNVEMDTFNIVIPRKARLGAGTIYFSLNGVNKPALSFTVTRPDILIPNKVFVQPFLFAYSDSVPRSFGGYDYIFPDQLKDGPSGTAIVNSVRKLTYDKDAQVFYFLDYQEGDHRLFIRKIKNGVVTTIAGGGEDYFANSGANLKLGTDDLTNAGNAGLDMDMKPGPDGKLYFVNAFTIRDGVDKPSQYSLIQRIDPNSGQVETLLGNNHRMVEDYYSNDRFNYRGFEDGPQDSAMIGGPNGLTFDNEGNLYFLDGQTLLRRWNKNNGRVETLLGKINRELYEFEDVDAKTYKVVFYSTIEEHSDGFGDEVRFLGARHMVRAGNGKFYIWSSGAGWGYNIVEVNLDTKEASTVIGQPDGSHPMLYTGTFKEVELTYASSFDVDFDGNIVFGFATLYKIDLQAETVAIMAGSQLTSIPPGYTSQRHFMQETQPGNACILGRMNRIVFDQFGNLYVGYDYVAASADVRIVKVIIER